MGGAGDSPAAVGDPPTGMGEAFVLKASSLVGKDAAFVPSGGSPDGTGESPVLPSFEFSNRLFVAKGENETNPAIWPNVSL